MFGINMIGIDVYQQFKEIKQTESWGRRGSGGGDTDEKGEKKGRSRQTKTFKTLNAF